LGHRICLMHNGQVVQVGTPAEVLYHPVNDFAKSFFAGSRVVLEYKIAALDALSPFLKEVLPRPLLPGSSVWDALQAFGAEDKYASSYTAVIEAFSQYRQLQTS